MTLALKPWKAPPSRPELTAGAVHLWRFPLSCPESLEPLLNEEEQQRARRLRLPAKALAFVVARARLRQILARYLDLNPRELCFSCGPFGKPALAGLVDPPAFNLAHSGNWGLCAVVKKGTVGVDVESVSSVLDYRKLAGGFFSAAEKKHLHDCPPWRRRREFFRVWTRKEAWLKGKGSGFSDPDLDIGHTHLQGCSTDDGRWQVRSFPVDRHYLGALAVSPEISHVQRWDGWPLKSL